MKNYVVTTSIGRRTDETISRKEIWQSDAPLKVGHPLQWLVENTEKGIRITDLRGKRGAVQNNLVREIPHAELIGKNEFELKPGQYGIRLKFEPATVLHPIDRVEGDILKIHRTMGNWVLDGVTLNPADKTSEIFTVGGKNVFKASWLDGSLQIEVLNSSVGSSKLTMKQGKEVKELEPKTLISFAKSDLRHLTLNMGSLQWAFGFASSAALRDVRSKNKLPTIDLASDQEGPWFQRSLRGAAIGLIIFLLMAWMTPKPKEELVPPQFAKIILTAPRKVQTGASEPAAAEKAALTKKKVQDTAVVQAFRAKALQSAVSNLMKGGMTKLLAQSDFISGHSTAADSRKLFETKTNDLRATALEAGDIANKNVKVATLGGDATPGGNGYAKGNHAAVKGQGKGFVSMDLGNSSVEEGLTKDEVGEVIHRHMSEVRYCYESAMIRTPDIEGKLTVDFTIGGNGVVKTAEAKASTLPDPRLDDCIIRRLVTWKFPNTKGGIDVGVTYPFIFKTLGR